MKSPCQRGELFDFWSKPQNRQLLINWKFRPTGLLLSLQLRQYWTFKIQSTRTSGEQSPHPMKLNTSSNYEIDYISDKRESLLLHNPPWPTIFLGARIQPQPKQSSQDTMFPLPVFPNYVLKFSTTADVNWKIQYHTPWHWKRFGEKYASGENRQQHPPPDDILGGINHCLRQEFMVHPTSTKLNCSQPSNLTSSKLYYSSLTFAFEQVTYFHGGKTWPTPWFLKTRETSKFIDYACSISTRRI